MNFATALLDAREMGEADRLTVVAGTSVSALMENAGRGVAQEVVRRVGPTPRRCRLERADRLAEFPRKLERRGALSRRRGTMEALTPAAIDNAELIIDAVFGAGLSRPLDGAAKETLAAAAAQRIPIVAVDIPQRRQGRYRREPRRRCLGADGNLFSQKARSSPVPRPRFVRRARRYRHRYAG